jgi:hypothetical protein
VFGVSAMSQTSLTRYRGVYLGIEYILREEYDCSLCEFKGATERSVKVHIRMKHVPGGKFYGGQVRGGAA